MEYVLQCLLIILPVLVAGLFFILSIKFEYFSYLKKPVDMGLMIGDRRLLGDNKMLRGFVVMSGATFLFVLGVGIMMDVFGLHADRIVFDYSVVGSYKAIMYGLAYSVGELPNSFIKRRFGIGPGMRATNRCARLFFDVFDKIDSLLVCSLALFFVYKIGFSYVAGAFLLGLLFHHLTDLGMVRLGLKEKR